MAEKDFPKILEGCHKLLKQFIEKTQAQAVRIDKLEQENKTIKELLNTNNGGL